MSVRISTIHDSRSYQINTYFGGEAVEIVRKSDSASCLM